MHQHTTFYRSCLKALKDKPGSIPHLVSKITPGLQSVWSKIDIISRRGAGSYGKTEGISAIFLYGVGRIHDIPPHLAHLLALFVTNQPMEVYGMEGNITCIFQAHHNHTGNPKK